MVNDFSKITVIIRASLFYVNNLIPFLFIYFQKELHHLSTSISIHLFSSKVPILKESYSMTSHFAPPIPSAVLIPSPVNRKELTIMTAWQYSGAGMINNYVAIGSALLLMASQIQYMGRLLGVAEVPKKYWPMLMAISILNALISMLIMKIFV